MTLLFTVGPTCNPSPPLPSGCDCFAYVLERTSIWARWLMMSGQNKKKSPLCCRKYVPLRAALLNLSSRFDQDSIVTWMQLFNSQDWNCHEEIEHFSAQYGGRWGNSPWRWWRRLVRQGDWTRRRCGHLVTLSSLTSQLSLHFQPTLFSPLCLSQVSSRAFFKANLTRKWTGVI